jgi:hypothetical protein
MVGPKPRNAFKIDECGMEARLLLPVGVWVKVKATGREHIVPFANIQSIEIEKESLASITDITSPKKIGRPPKEQTLGPA